MARWRRRSRMIAVFRIGLPVVIGVIVVVFTAWAFFGDLAVRVGVDQSDAGAGSIHMTNARFLGRDEQGRAYVLTAAGAVRDNMNPMLIALARPAMVFDADGANPTHLSADKGVYREDTRILMLDGHVTLHDAIGPLSARPVLVTFFGHTHLQGAFSFKTAAGDAYRPAYKTVGQSEDSRFALKRDVRYLINPGSVGQPRDGDWRAAFAVFDTDNWMVTFQRAPYNLKNAQDRIFAANLPQRLATRLAAGR